MDSFGEGSEKKQTNEAISVHDPAPTAPSSERGTLTMLTHQDLINYGKEVPTDGTVFWEADAQMVATLVTKAQMNVNQVNSEGKSILGVAAACGHVKLVVCLLEKGALVDNHGERADFSPLMEAAAFGHHHIVELLIKHGADVNKKTVNNSTSLHYACASDHPRVVEILLSAGAIINMSNDQGSTPFTEAAACGSVGSARAILLKDPTALHPVFEIADEMSNCLKDTPLSITCYKGHLEMARFLLKIGREHDNFTREELFGSLIEACVDGHLEVVRLLLEFGADVNPITRNFESPLSLAASGGFLELAQLFLDHGANIDIQNEEGVTPLMEAARENHILLVRELIKRGANVNTRISETWETALSMAAAAGSLEVVDTLIGAGIEIAQSINVALLEAASYGHLKIVTRLLSLGAALDFESPLTLDTPLSCACENGNFEVVRYLVDRGANVEHLSQDGLTPLMRAAKNGNLDSVQLLVSSGVKVDRYVEQFDRTALTVACMCGHYDVARFLVRTGANPHRPMRGNVTPLMHACRGGHLSVASFLLEPLLALVEATSPDQNDFSGQVSFNHTEPCAKAEPSHDSGQNLGPSTTSSSLECPQCSSSCSHIESPLGDLNVSQQQSSKTISVVSDIVNIKPTHGKVVQKNSPIKQPIQKSNNTEKSGLSILKNNEEVQNLVQSFKEKRQTAGSLLKSKFLAKVQLKRASKTPQKVPDNVDVNAVSESTRESALSIACAEGHTELVALLLGKGAYPDHRDRNGFTPLMLAVHRGSLLIVNHLLAVGASTELRCDKNQNTALTLACANNRLDIVRVLVSCGARLEHRTISEYTPLMLACNTGHLEIATMLLDHGADPNAAGQGVTPLMLAAMGGYTFIVKLLLERGANPAFEHMRNSALTLACNNKHTNVVATLLERKVNLEQRNKEGRTALMEAASVGHIQIATLLIKAGADVNASSGPAARETPLLIAAEMGRHDFLELLLTHNANTELKNKKGCTALWVAASNGFLESVEVLNRFSARFDIVDGRDVSALKAALRRGHLNVVRVLASKVTRFPSDNECKKLLNTLPTNDKNFDNRFSECLDVIMEAKAKQEVEAQRAASDLIKMESQEREKKSSASKKREKKKKRKAKTLEAKREETLSKPEELPLPKPPESPKPVKTPKPHPKLVPDRLPSSDFSIELSDSEEWKHVRRRPTTAKTDSSRRAVRTQIPSHLVSRFIGKNGAFVNALRVKTNTLIDIDTTKKGPFGDCSITIKGLFRDIRTVLSLIAAVIAEPDRMTLSTLNDLEYIRQTLEPVSYVTINTFSQRASYPSALPLHRALPTPSTPISVSSVVFNPTFDSPHLFVPHKFDENRNNNRDISKVSTSSTNSVRSSNYSENEKLSLNQRTSQVSYPGKQSPNLALDLCPGSGRPPPLPMFPSEFNRKTWDAIYNGKNKVGARFDKNLWMRTSLEMDSNSDDQIDQMQKLMDSVPQMNNVDDFARWFEGLKLPIRPK